jgi:type III secretion system YscQ/HrcQ family protein
VRRGRADLDPVVRALGDRAARAAAEGMTSALGLEVRLRGRPLPAGASLGSATLVPLDLPALPASAVLAVECSLVARLAERLAGGPGDDWLASALTPAESAVLDLLVLAGLQGLGRIDEVEAALAPRLGLRPAHVESPLAIDLSVEAGEVAGRALLALPLSAVRALRGPPELGGAIERVTIEGSLRSGQVRLEPDELAAVEPGDVLLLDAPPGGTARLTLRGGAEVAGRLAAGELEVEEVGMARVTDVAAGLPLLLEVELGRVPVALGDLARLEVGGVLPLGLDRSGRVTLRLGDRELAIGELVDVEGSVGVRVLRLAGQP